MSDSKQSYREWEAEYERKLAWLRLKYKHLITSPEPK